MLLLGFGVYIAVTVFPLEAGFVVKPVTTIPVNISKFKVVKVREFPMVKFCDIPVVVKPGGSTAITLTKSLYCPLK